MGSVPPIYFSMRTARRPSLRIVKTEPNRKSPVHLPAREIFNAPVIVILTGCTKGRKPILADNETDALLHEAWRAAGAGLVGSSVIMLDHVHLFCALTGQHS